MHATTSPKAIDLKPAALALVAAAVFAGGIILGSAVDFPIAAAPAAGVAADHSYDGMEASRLSAVDTSPSLTGKSGYPSTRGSESLAGLTSAGQEYVDYYLGSAGAVAARDNARGDAGWWASAPVAGTTSAGQQYVDHYLRSMRAVAPAAGADPNTRFGPGIR